MENWIPLGTNITNEARKEWTLHFHPQGASMFLKKRTIQFFGLVQPLTVPKWKKSWNVLSFTPKYIICPMCKKKLQKKVTFTHPTVQVPREPLLHHASCKGRNIRYRDTEVRTDCDVQEAKDEDREECGACGQCDSCCDSCCCSFWSWVLALLFAVFGFLGKYISQAWFFCFLNHVMSSK